MSSSLIHGMMRIIIFFVFHYINFLVESEKINGFSAELIHVNSPLSPFYNSNITRQGYSKEIESSILIHETAFYLMKISYGKPPVSLYQILDTGSELSWIQCAPCTRCFHSVSPPFNPNHSSTFEYQHCPTPNNRCPYKLAYRDQSQTRGYLAKETIKVGSGTHKIKFSNFIFGCSYDNVGYFPYTGAGILGLNLKEKSFIAQLHSQHNGIFSYCMAPPGSTQAGKISFGHEARVSDNNVMTTPLILNTHYNIVLTGISVGNKTLKYFPDSYSSSSDLKGNNSQLQLIIDTGSNIMHVSNSFYSDVEKTIIKYIHGKKPIGGVGGHKLCYSSSLTNAEIPKVKLHFPGVVLEMSPYNIFVDSSRHRCLAIMPNNDTFVLGNMAQINFLVGYNLEEKKLSFKPTDCAE